MRLFLTLYVCSIMISCSSTSGIVEGKNNPEDYFYVQKPKNSNGKWAVFLPGTSGLTVFEDDKHYFNVASKLNEQGYTVVLVDYKPAYKTSGRKVKETTGEKILWVTEQAINWAIKNNHIDKNQKGNIVGWSLAGEGLVLLANNPDKIKQLHVKSIAMFYPSNQNEVTLNSQIPVLIQSGVLDGVTPKSQIEKFFRKDNQASIIFYDNAHHGFDIKSLKEAKSMRFPPVVGKKYKFQYSEDAALKAMNELIEFIK